MNCQILFMGKMRKIASINRLLNLPRVIKVYLKYTKAENKQLKK